MQGSKTDSFAKIKKVNKRFDDGTGKRTNSKKQSYSNKTYKHPEQH